MPGPFQVSPDFFIQIRVGEGDKIPLGKHTNQFSIFIDNRKVTKPLIRHDLKPIYQIIVFICGTHIATHDFRYFGILGI